MELNFKKGSEKALLAKIKLVNHEISNFEQGMTNSEVKHILLHSKFYFGQKWGEDL